MRKHIRPTSVGDGHNVGLRVVFYLLMIDLGKSESTVRTSKSQPRRGDQCPHCIDLYFTKTPENGAYSHLQRQKIKNAHIRQTGGPLVWRMTSSTPCMPPRSAVLV